ncbi:MAG: AMP-binding protein, partial [Lentisphaeraceae bacterium]|nr:AMP-binding protein [Lentisphaeraceae bacterium]
MKNIFQLLGQATELYGSKVYIDYPGADGRQQLTYSQFRDEVEKQAQVLLDLGVKRGDRVAFLTPKSYLQSFLFYAIWRINAIAVPVSESMGKDEVAFIINDASPSLVILHSSLRANESHIAAGRHVIYFDDLAEPKSTELPSCDLKLDDTAVLIYTSGSTGKPKGVMLSHRNLMVNARASSDALILSDDERLLSILPYWHSFALIAELIMMVMIKGTVVFAKDQKDFARNMAKMAPTMMLAVPRMLAQFKMMIEKGIEKKGAEAVFTACLDNADQLYIGDGVYNQDPTIRAQRTFFEENLLNSIKKTFGPRFKFFIGGGAPLAPELQMFFRNLDLPVFQGYGLTETSPVISCNTPENNRIGSSGKVLSWLKPENGGDFTFLNSAGERSKDHEGELLEKGDSVMQGYWGHKDISAKALVDGWLYTGDVAYMKDAYIYISGRASNLLVLKGGEKVHPEHVEEIAK